MAKTIEGRIGNVAGDLTLEERARLVLAAWCEDEQPDEALLRPLRYGDDIAQRRLVDRVVNANQYAAGQLSYWQLFVCELEVYLLWLERATDSGRRSADRSRQGARPHAGTSVQASRCCTARATGSAGTTSCQRSTACPTRSKTISPPSLGIAGAIWARWNWSSVLSSEYGCATMHREVRETVAELRAKLLDIRERLGIVPAPVLPEPQPGDVEAVCATILPQQERT